MQNEAEETKQEPESGWTYNRDKENSVSNDSYRESEPANQQAVSWSASEYVAHDKDRSWYAFVSLAILGMAVLVYFVAGGWFSSAMIVLIGGAFILSAQRPPKVLNYSVSSAGITVGSKTHSFADFKSFSVIEEGALDSIMLIPMQRFMPSLSIYFEPKEEQKIVDAIAVHLPYEERQQAAIDKLMRKIRF